MIYAKIYLDDSENGEKTLIIEASKEEDGIYFYHAKKLYDKSGRLRFHDPHTTLGSIGGIAISPEAKAFFSARLDDTESYDLTNEAGDFALVEGERTSYGGWERSYFAFHPDETTFPLRRVLKETDRFTLSISNGFSKNIFDQMHEADNEHLKSLDLTTPVSKDSLPQ